MLDPFILVAIAALGGGVVSVACWPAIAAAFAITFAWRRHVSRAALIACVAIFGLQAARASVAIRWARAAYARALAGIPLGARCEIEAEIVSSPVAGERERSTEDAGAVDGDALVLTTSAAVQIARGTCAETEVPAGIVARVHELPDDLRRGDVVQIVLDLKPIHLFEHDELRSPWPAIAGSSVVASGTALSVDRIDRGIGVGAWIDAARAHVRRRIVATYPAEVEAHGRALVLGEGRLAEEEAARFRNSGLLHLLAVSGTHLVLVIGAIGAALRWILLRALPGLSARMDTNRIAAGIGIAAAWIYADFAGGSGSAVRAAAMVTAALAATAIGGRPNAGRALALGLAGAAIWDPLAIADPSFGLSAGAAVGLAVLGGALRRAWEPLRARWIARSAVTGSMSRGERTRATAAGLAKRGASAIVEPMATTIAASVGAMPALLTMSPRVTWVGLLTNLVAAPLGEWFALPACLAHAALGLLPPIERVLAWTGGGALAAVRIVASAGAAAGPGLEVSPPTPWQLAWVAGVAAFAVAWGRSRGARRPGARGASAIAVAVAGWLALELVAMRRGSPKGTLRITALDVGQGDAILVDLPDGRGMLVDGGGLVGSSVDTGSRVVLPVLAARRRQRLDVIVLSHPHPDHFLGLVTVATKLPFGALWDTGQGEEHGAHGPYAALLGSARDRGAQILRPKALCGRPIVFEGGGVDVIAPCPDRDPDLSANDASFVLRISYGRRRALLMGDAETEAESRLRAGGADLRADVLKVGHHGSRTSSTPSFLDAVGPSAAIISCGVRNRFGHPHAVVSDRLAQRGIAVLRTDRGGAVTWSTDGERTWVDRPTP